MAATILHFKYDWGCMICDVCCVSHFHAFSIHMTVHSIWFKLIQAEWIKASAADSMVDSQ